MDTGLFVFKTLLTTMMYIILVFATWGFSCVVLVFFMVKTVKKILKTKFFTSLSAYLKLYRAGLSITHYECSKDFHINRFYWHGTMISEIPDIDMVNGHYNTLKDGHVEPLN